MVAACVRADVRFSITVRQDRSIRRAIAAIDDNAWIPIHYPNAIYDENTGGWISDAEIAETTYAAFASRRKSQRITVRLIVRRVKDKNVPECQGELFTAWRYHAFITDSQVELVQAEKHHPEPAIIEQVNADLKDSARAHMPSGSFAANACTTSLPNSRPSSYAARARPSLVRWPVRVRPGDVPVHQASRRIRLIAVMVKTCARCERSHRGNPTGHDPRCARPSWVWHDARPRRPALSQIGDPQGFSLSAACPDIRNA